MIVASGGSDPSTEGWTAWSDGEAHRVGGLV